MIYSDYKIYYHVDIYSDRDINTDFLEKNNLFLIEKYEPINTVSIRSGVKSRESYLRFSDIKSGKDSTLNSLNTFIKSMVEISTFLNIFSKESKTIYIDVYYKYQCNFEIDIVLLNILCELGISLAVSCYKEC